jgi:hypothetical protein
MPKKVAVKAGAATNRALNVEVGFTFVILRGLFKNVASPRREECRASIRAIQLAT